MKKQFRIEDLLKGAPVEILKSLLKEVDDLPDKLRSGIDQLPEEALLKLAIKYVESDTLSSSMATWVRVEQKDGGGISLIMIGKAVEEIPFKEVFSDKKMRTACLAVSSFCFEKTTFSSKDLSTLHELKKIIISLVNEKYPDLNYSGLRLTDDENEIFVRVSCLETPEFDSFDDLLEKIIKDRFESSPDPTSPFEPFSTIP